MNNVKQIIKKLSGFSIIDRFFRKRHTGFEDGERYNRGHFYSPLPDIEEVQKNKKELFKKDVDLGDSINLNSDSQYSLLLELVSFYDDFWWPEQPSPKYRYNFKQRYFCYGDALILYSLMRHLKPKRIIEVGSGFTSALMLDTNNLFLENSIRFTFIEPYPDRLFSLLREQDNERCKIIQDKVQNIPIATFKELEKNDILFIDSSHVSKIGSDVNFLIFEVLPNLKPGVVVHFHDVLWPFEYPKDWVVNKRAWNEVYILRAFLQYNRSFEILIFNSYAGHIFEEFFKESMPIFIKDSGGSIWMRKSR